MKKLLIFIFFILLISYCNAEEIAEIDLVEESSYLKISLWHWHKSPVIIPGGSLWLGFTCRNESDDTLDFEKFCKESSIMLINPDNDTLLVRGDKLAEIADYIRDIAPHSVRTAVFEVQTLFEFNILGDYLLIWITSFGNVKFNIYALEELDYLIYRFEHDEAYNEWGLHLYGLDGFIYDDYLSAKLINYGENAIIKLLPYLRDEGDCFIEGSEDATIGSMYSYRKMDFAAIMIANILNIEIPELREMKREDRDVGIEILRDRDY